MFGRMLWIAATCGRSGKQLLSQRFQPCKTLRGFASFSCSARRTHGHASIACLSRSVLPFQQQTAVSRWQKTPATFARRALSVSGSAQQLHVKNTASAQDGEDVSLASNKSHALLQEHGKFRYALLIQTGTPRAAGVGTPVVLRLVGSKGTSPIIELVPSVGRFERGSCERFDVMLDEDIGDLRSLQVGLVKEPAREGWYLEHIEVRAYDRPTGQADKDQEKVGRNQKDQKSAVDDIAPVVASSKQFSCRRWLGVNEASGEVCLDALELYPDAPASHLGQPVHQPEDILVSPVTLMHSAVCFPQPAKVRRGARGHCTRWSGYGGEDAYAVAYDEAYCVMAIADGVHEWSMDGIDSGLMSRSLVDGVAELFRQEVALRAAHRRRQSGDQSQPANTEATSEGEGPHPLRLLREAWGGVLQQQLQGSTTACVITIDGEAGLLRAANLGDSGFLVVRGLTNTTYAKNRRKLQSRARLHSAVTPINPDSVDQPTIIFSTPQQEHSFGRPYQLGHHAASDAPDDANVVQLLIRPGDVVVCGTDGLFDNVSHKEMVALLQRTARPWNAASELAKLAFDRSGDKSASTPWSRAATDELNLFYTGGKPDDITVVVAEIINHPAA